MTDKNLRSQLQVGELGERASSAASALLGKATLATAPDLRHVAVARRLSVVAALAAFALVVGGIFAVSLFASGASALDRGHRPGHGGRWRDRFGPACRGPRLVRAVAGHGPGRDLGAWWFRPGVGRPRQPGYSPSLAFAKRLCGARLSSSRRSRTGMPWDRRAAPRCRSVPMGSPSARSPLSDWQRLTTRPGPRSP